MPAGWRWALAAAAAAAAGGARGLDLKCGADHDCSMLPDMADPANLRHLKCVLRRSSRVVARRPLTDSCLGVRAGAGRASSQPCSLRMR